MPKIGHFFEIKKKLSPGNGMKKAYAKFELIWLTRIYETKLQNFSNLKKLSKCPKSVILSKFKKRKKIVRREWSEEGTCKI